MPGSISNYAENVFLDHIFNSAFTPAVSMYLAIGDGLVADASLSGEPVGDGYARKIITFGAAASRMVIQSGDITFGPATAGWGSKDHWALYDELSGGNCWATGEFSTAKDCSNGRSPKVLSGEIQVQISAGAISTTWAHNLLNRAFRNITSGTGKPDTFLALCETAPIDSDGDISAKEPSDGNYARVQVNPNGGATPVWNLAADGALDNDDNISFPTPGATWAITYMAICNALTVGELILYDDITDETIGSGDPVSFPALALDASIS